MVDNMVILIPFTVGSLSEARGGGMIQQLEILLKSFQKSPKEMTKSIIPIVTKVNPEDKHLNIETIRHDLEEVMSKNLELYLSQLQSSNSDGDKTQNNPEKAIEVTEEDFNQYDKERTRMNVNPAKRKIIREYLERKYFFEQFFISSKISK